MTFCVVCSEGRQRINVQGRCPHHVTLCQLMCWRTGIVSTISLLFVFFVVSLLVLVTVLLQHLIWQMQRCGNELVCSPMESGNIVWQIEIIMALPVRPTVILLTSETLFSLKPFTVLEVIDGNCAKCLLYITLLFTDSYCSAIHWREPAGWTKVPNLPNPCGCNAETFFVLKPFLAK